MSNPLAVTYVDLVGPPVSAAWLNAVTAAANSMLNFSPTVVIAAAGQTTITVPVIASNMVYINGVFQIYGDSYTRTSDTTITFSESLPYGAKVVVL